MLDFDPFDFGNLKFNPPVGIRVIHAHRYLHVVRETEQQRMHFYVFKRGSNFELHGASPAIYPNAASVLVVSDRTRLNVGPELARVLHLIGYGKYGEAPTPKPKIRTCPECFYSSPYHHPGCSKLQA